MSSCSQDQQFINVGNDPNESFHDDLNVSETSNGFNAHDEMNKFDENGVDISQSEKVSISRCNNLNLVIFNQSKFSS